MWDMARAGDVLLDMPDSEAAMEFAVATRSSSANGEGIARPVEEPDEVMATGLCLAPSSNCIMGNSSSSCLSVGQEQSIVRLETINYVSEYSNLPKNVLKMYSEI